MTSAGETEPPFTPAQCAWLREMLPPSSSQPTPGSAGTQPVDGKQHTQSPEGEASDTSGTHRVVCHCDNQAVVAALGSRSCRDSHCVHLLRELVFVEAQHAFRLQPVYIQSAANDLADDLSRNKLSSFLLKVPQAGMATSLPTALVSLLLDQSQDWTSPTWLRQFSAIFSTAWPPRQGEPITQQ